MKTLVQIATCLALIPWLGAMMMSPMLFAAGGNWSRGFVAIVGVVLFFPSLVFLVYRCLGWNFLSVSPTLWLAASLMVNVLVACLYDYPNTVANTLRGIPRSGYFKTADAVYRDGHRLEGAEPQSFVELDYAYCKDRTHVFRYGDLVPGVDAATFTVFPDSPFTKDAHHVYLHRQVLEGVDAKSFVQLSGNLGKDATRIFHNDTPILPQADTASFAPLTDLVDNEFGRDHANVYQISSGRTVTGADPNTFKVLSERYAKDKARVYYRAGRDEECQVVEGARPKSFRLNKRYDPAATSDAHDAHNHYFQGVRVDKPAPGG